MIAKCANPDCSVGFRYLRGGKLFLLHIPHNPLGEGTHRREYFWLCDQCSARMKVVINERGEAAVVGPLGAGPNRALRAVV